MIAMKICIGNKIEETKWNAKWNMTKKASQFSLLSFPSRTDARGRRFLFTGAREVAH